MGQFLEDLELAHREHLAVTTFPYHHNSTNCITIAVNGVDIVFSIASASSFPLSSVALADPWSTVR